MRGQFVNGGLSCWEVNGNGRKCISYIYISKSLLLFKPRRLSKVNNEYKRYTCSIKYQL